jgi:hypothetical protein
MQILGKRLKTAHRAGIPFLRDSHENFSRSYIDSCCVRLDTSETGNRTSLASSLLLFASLVTHAFLLLDHGVGQVVFSQEIS